MSVLNSTDLFYFRISISNVPFAELPFNISYKYAYCRFYNTSMLTEQKDIFNVVGVYNYFSIDPLDNSTVLLEKDLLFGEVLSYDPPLRREGKWVITGKQPIASQAINLPEFKVGKDSGFYVKDGIYHIFSAVKSTKEKVSHLEWPYLYGQNSIKLRIVVELLKIESKSNGISISLNEWKDIAFKVLRNESINKKNSDIEIKDVVKSLLPDMLDQPIYSDIPPDYRGRAIR
jgi:hypothetical protein